jgi:Fur family transcriptional regulator, ferric uptake regulator
MIWSRMGVTSPDWAELASGMLRDQGHRAGAARATVIDVLSRADCCLTAQEIWDAIRGRGDAVGIASVYRTLDLLQERGLVQKIELGAGRAHYEAIRPEAHHHHLVCDECGRVDAFEDDALETTLQRVERESDYVVARHDVLLRGTCDDCRLALA